MSADQQTSVWIYRDSYPVGRKGSFEEAQTVAAKEFDNHPNSTITIEKQTLTRQVMRTYQPFVRREKEY